MYKISIEEAPDWVGRLGPKLRKASLKGMLSAGVRLVSVIQNEIIPREERVPVDRGLYKAGWRADKASYGALVHNDAPHAAVIEHGVRAHNVKIGRVMIDALTEWVIRKGLVSKGTGRIQRAAARVQAEGVAWAIARDMQKRGIFKMGKGLGILEKAVKRAPAIIKEEIKREIDIAKRTR